MSVRSEVPATAAGDGIGCGDEFMLFGVRVRVDPMRKCVSLNNLSDYEPVGNVGNPSGDEPTKEATDGGGAAVYVSGDDALPRLRNRSRERKRGVPWTEEEHKLFLIGLQKAGKGDWRGISRNYVKTRTPTQVASHAQKYFLRRSNYNRRRRRTSLFDITTDSVTAVAMEEIRNHQDSPSIAQPVMQAAACSANGFSVVPFPVSCDPDLGSMQGGNSIQDQNQLVCAVPAHPMPSSPTMLDLNKDQQVAANPSTLLSLSLAHNQPSTGDSAFQVISGLKNGDCRISVA